MSNSNKVPVLKVLILGSSGVGKTSLLSRFVDDVFTNRYKATIGADFKTKDIIVNDQPVALQIWDTAGQERFQSLGQAFYRGADICFLVFDLTKNESFEALETWRDEFLLQVAPPDEDSFPFAVIGNKVDLEAERTVAKNRVLGWCASKGSGMTYFETSAKDSTNVAKAFKSMAQKALVQVTQTRHLYNPNPTDNVVLRDKKPSNCC